ncbi:DEAD/DEAH box helicase family protein [Clostridium perfringens]|uniref:DEAD/DEAH box helicase family protein n=1 Tax=Clostridium perfringens TaxID=1502 RepID=UPI00224618CD|nr:DEAD/DEAH box helicase family protein [Clostridium perfringens]MCX0395230.1 DEAD/DEAH box helicase family protein [Clostridium perfringens]
MAFKRISTNNNNFNSPQELFTDIKNKTVNGLLDHQSQMINEYMEKYFSKKDIAMELPTGSGKTLVGLLIGEFRRIKKNEKVLYLCQNKQLVNQVVTQSKNKYGIKTTGYIGKTDEFTPTQKTNYITNKTISVTTYRSFFNNKTFFENPDLIIFDDAHSAESFIASFWSINIIKKIIKIYFLILLTC